MREVEQSLRRLRTDYLDIYLLHSPDEDLYRDDGLGGAGAPEGAGKNPRDVGFSVMSEDEGIPLAMRLIEQGRGGCHTAGIPAAVHTLPAARDSSPWPRRETSG